ncbi:VOC family protein [Georgenia sp. EYE_87]|uniref:VOC family protein n=1 Tax=Georgenia sp. EYE_87 TaxID=2853448 RepID=UPI0020045A77|nr:VOC family protein [Georgenia sp. EYE_87]MCK6211067.1 VOC family protein [Georgenia sp. EYE_87]
MALGAVSEMGYLAMRTRAYEESLQLATEVLGLRLTRDSGDRAYLAAADRHHELVYVKGDADGIDHIGLVAESAESLEVIRKKVEAGRFRIITRSPFEEAIGEGFAFVGPENYVFHIYTGMAGHRHGPASFGPDRYGHINIHPQDARAMKDFLVEFLGFKVSDVIGQNFAYFLRCNADHHGVAIIKGRGSLHHHAWQTQSIADLGRLGDRLFALGRRLIWGPVRHGAGHNIAAYYVEPNGTVVELYTDLEQIHDELRPPIEWSADDRTWFNRWGVYNGEDFRSHGAFPVELA